METTTQVQILDKAVCILLHAHAFGKIMNSSLLLHLWINSRADWLL